MALNTCEMRSNGTKIAFFSKNLQKSPSGWELCPQTPIASGGWGLRPQTPVCDTFEYTSLLNTSPNLDLHILTITFALSITKILVKSQRATASDLPFYDIFAPQKVPFLKISDDVIACDLWFGPPPIKNPGYAYAWPRPFLSLASRESVPEKLVLGLGLEPCVLDSTSVSYFTLSTIYNS